MARSINIQVEVRNSEYPERAIRKFLKKVKKERIIENYRNNMYYEKKSTKRRRKKINRKRVLQKLHEEAEKKTN